MVKIVTRLKKIKTPDGAAFQKAVGTRWEKGLRLSTGATKSSYKEGVLQPFSFGAPTLSYLRRSKTQGSQLEKLPDRGTGSLHTV